MHVFLGVQGAVLIPGRQQELLFHHDHLHPEYFSVYLIYLIILLIRFKRPEDPIIFII